MAEISDEKLIEKIYNRIWDYVEGNCGVADVIQDVLSSTRDEEFAVEPEEGDNN